MRHKILDLRKREKGFTLLELLLVVILVSLMFSFTLPVSHDMAKRFKAALRAQEVMMYVSELRRDAFLHSERHCLDSRNSLLTVDGQEIPFAGVTISVEEPIYFYRNGATSNGRIRIVAGEKRYILNVTAPFGALNLEAEETTA